MSVPRTDLDGSSFDDGAALWHLSAETLRSHPGQVAFPGGGIESTDVDPVAAALREANEEVGVDPSAVTVLGVLPAAHIPRSGFDVTSVVGWWGDPVPLVPVDVGEIAAVHQVSVASLSRPRESIRSSVVLQGAASPRRGTVTGVVLPQG